jgi:diacylglycerol O-acyltransferase / wax synthase
VKRLNGMDAILLYSETPNVHTHTLKIAIVDNSNGRFTVDLFRETLLHSSRTEIPRLPAKCRTATG